MGPLQREMRWVCRLTREFNWWPNWLSMRFHGKLLSQHSRALRALSKIRQQHLSNRSVCVCRPPTRGHPRAEMDERLHAPEGGKLDYIAQDICIYILIIRNCRNIRKSRTPETSNKNKHRLSNNYCAQKFFRVCELNHRRLNIDWVSYLISSTNNLYMKQINYVYNMND